MVLNELDGIYDNLILDHCRNPRNQTKLKRVDIECNGVNSFCGDEVHIQLALDVDGRVIDIGAQSQGCSINQATSSMATEAIKGKTLIEITELSNSFLRMMHQVGDWENDLQHLGDLRILSAVRQFPVRLKCAFLIWDAIDDGLRAHANRLPPICS